MDNKEIGIYLKGLRNLKGLSQGEVASICSVSHQAVSKWEKGESLPDLSSLQLLGSFYEITIDEILAAQSNEVEDEKLLKRSNRNKEIIKITMSILMGLVLFLPFLDNDLLGSENGYQLIFKGVFGFEVTTSVILFTYLLFQIVFSIFTITKVISFSKGNIYLNRVITILVLVLVLFCLALQILLPSPLIIFIIYLISMYIISTRILMNVDSKLALAKRESRYEPYVYIIFYFLVMSVLPVYTFFNNWFIDVSNIEIYFIAVFYIVSIVTLVIGFELRNSNKRVSKVMKLANVYSFRLLYLFVFFLAFTESHMFELTKDRYDGIVLVILYVGFDLLISSLYKQSVNLKGKTKPFFKND